MSTMSRYLSQDRREAVAAQINSAILRTRHISCDEQWQTQLLKTESRRSNWIEYYTRFGTIQTIHHRIYQARRGKEFKFVLICILYVCDYKVEIMIFVVAHFSRHQNPISGFEWSLFEWSSPGVWIFDRIWNVPSLERGNSLSSVENLAKINIEWKLGKSR